MRVRTFPLLFLVCIAATFVGCGGASAPNIVPVEGVVMLGGQPLPKAEVRFIPQLDVGNGHIATAVTDENGRYQLMCNGKSGACEGENLVVVAEADVPTELLSENAQEELAAYRKSLSNRPIPTGYSSPVNTPLRITISADKSNYPIDLER